MDLRNEFGTKEYYIEYERKEAIKNITNYLVENEHLSYQEANQKAKIMLNVNIDN